MENGLKRKKNVGYFLRKKKNNKRSQFFKKGGKGLKKILEKNKRKK
jgi:hypothetical protein